jgi:predicted transcriptional regulator
MAMDTQKRARLEAAGFRVGSAQEFLGLTADENALIDMRLALSAAIRHRRQTQHLSQVGLASRLQSSQSRVAKIEAGDPSVSVDLLVRALLATGATRKEVGEVISGKPETWSQSKEDVRVAS